MRIAAMLDTEGSIDTTIERATHLHSLGFRSMWASQTFGPDTLTVLSIVGRSLRDVDLGTAVVPVQPRHPTMLAAQARTVQEAIGATLSLGIGLSHQVVVEGLWGLSFDHPARYMREYIDALGPMLRGDNVNVQGERVSALTFNPLGPAQTRTPGLLLAALGPKMLSLAGAMTDGTVLWMTGVKTIASHISPLLREAAANAGRGEPRVVCALPITVTKDIEKAKALINEHYAVYATLPSYTAMMEREGAREPADVGIIGSAEQVLEQLHGLRDAGVTEFAGAPSGTPDEQDATLQVLVHYAALH